MDNQIEVVELRSHRIEEIRGYAAGSSVQHGGELRQADRRAGKLRLEPRRRMTCSIGIARHFRVR